VTLTLVSTKEQIVLTAERLFAAYGVEGVSLRQVGAAAGTANHSAVQYHFGSKSQLIRAIFLYRLPHLEERRRILVARRRPDDIPSWVECHILPMLEQGEQRGSHYLSFVAMLQQSPDRHLCESIPRELGTSTQQFFVAMDELLGHLPAPLRRHRLEQAITFAVHAAAGRERSQAAGVEVLPFALHVADLLDGLVGFLEAAASPAAISALDEAEPSSLGLPLVV
jgi:AcrR family transcriptional regulator